MSERLHGKLKATLAGALVKISPGSTVYSGLRTSLTLLKETADISELPALKGAVGGLLKVVEIIEKMSQNQNDAAELLGYLRDLQKMLNDTQTSKISESLASRIGELSQQITMIVHNIREIRGRKAIFRFMRNDTDANTLVGHIQAINRLFLKFLLGSSVAIEVQMAAVAEGMGTIEGEMSNMRHDFKHLMQDGLPRVVEARFDGDKRQRCLEGTRVALLDTIHIWSRQETSSDGQPIPSIFWLCGQAGTGKTTIAYSTANDCHDQGRLGASFFFSRDHSDRNDIRLVFPTLAHQLGTFCTDFKALLTRILQEDPDLAYVDPAYQLKNLIINPLANCASFPSSTVIVIDALDECRDDTPISTILSLLSDNLPRLSRLKFFITSRPENNIRLGFEPLRQVAQSLILHDIDASIVDADIELYLRQGLSIASRIYPHLIVQGWPSDEAIRSLVQKSCRLFIFAATALKFIMDDIYSDPTNQLTVLLGPTPGIEPSPSSPFFFLDRLYLQVLRQAFPRSISPNRLTLIRMLLAAIVLLRNPLSPEALGDLLRLRHGIVRTTLRHLHSVIVVPDTEKHVIRLIHPTFFDFLMTRCPEPQFRIHSTFYHEQLAIICFEQMKALKRDICEINDGSKLNAEVEDLVERVRQHISPALRYACHHWVFHLCNADESTLLQALLREFCLERLLYWIEVLSLTDSLRDGIRQIQTVLNHLAKIPFVPEELLSILKDIVLFVPEYFELISSASLQLYRSALPLSPLLSSLCKAFVHELNGGVRVLQGAGQANHPGVTILHGHSNNICSACFSPDGTLVISASDEEARLWDRGTGTLLKTFTTESFLYSRIIWVNFLPNGDRVILGTTTANIYIWDVTTGVCLGTTELEGGYTWISSYTCSPNVTRIVGSAGGDVLLWDSSNGTVLNTLRGHDGDVRCVAFSPRDMLIASASEDRTIRIWHAVSGTGLKTLTGHSNYVETVAFSPCGRFLISGSWDNNLRLWDPASGVALMIFQGHLDWVRSVAFSPSSIQIISGSDDETLRVWDAVEGRLVKTLTVGHGWRVMNVGFSFDGTHYICTGDKDIYIWDIDRASDLNRSEGELIHVKFSPNGAYLIGSIVGKPDIYLWSGFTGTLLKVLKGHSNPIHSLAFSPNNQCIASGSWDNTIRVWDIASRTSLKTLRGHSDFITSVAFSPDSTQIVSISLDKTLRIWNTSSGDNLFTIEGYHSSAYFSSDGSQIIAGNLNYNIPPPIRSHPVSLNDPATARLQYIIEGEWVFASRGNKKERCIWLPVDWRRYNDISSSRVAIGTRYGLVLLDLSDITLTI